MNIKREQPAQDWVKKKTDLNCCVNLNYCKRISDIIYHNIIPFTF